MKLSTKSQYAVMAMLDLACHSTKRPVSLAEISCRQNLPVQYLEQLFSKLKKKNLVKSLRGQLGGYQLGRSAGEIRVADIVLAAGEVIKATRCDRESLKGCQNATAKCLAHNLWAGLDDHIMEYLNGISLQDVYERSLEPGSMVA